MAQVQRRSAEELLGSLGRMLDDVFDPAKIDGLQVQASLGRMEARDRLRPVLDRLVDALDEVRREVDDFIREEATDPLHLREGVGTALHDLRREVESAPEIR